MKIQHSVTVIRISFLWQLRGCTLISELCLISPFHIKAERGAKTALRSSPRTKADCPSRIWANLSVLVLFLQPTDLRRAGFLLRRQPTPHYATAQTSLGGQHTPWAPATLQVTWASKGTGTPSSTRHGLRGSGPCPHQRVGPTLVRQGPAQCSCFGAELHTCADVPQPWRIQAPE